MYKVMLVEDELLVRIGLKNSVNWQEFDMEIVAEEDNGTNAFHKYISLQPDVVITDIRMPGMNGMELIQKIRETDSRCAIIVISCMDDFKLLQDAIRCNVQGYVLKASMTIKEITELLEQARLRLDRIPRAGKEQEQESPSRHELLMDYVVNKELEEEEFEDKWKKAGYPLPEYRSATIFRFLPLNGGPLNEMGIAFMQSAIRENLPDSDIFSKDGSIIALHPDSILCTDSRLGRISRMTQSFLEGQFSQITQKISQSLDTLPAEVEGLLDMCDCRLQNMDNTIFRAVDYILNHYSEHLTLKVIADQVGLSPNYFSSFFKKETGVAFVNYLNEIRMEKAKLLLGNTDEYLYLIAEETGFQTVEHFSRLFGQREGMSPGEWRRSRYRRREAGAEEDE